MRLDRRATAASLAMPLKRPRRLRRRGR